MLYLKGPNEFTLGSSPFVVAGQNGALELKQVDKAEIESIPENNSFNPVNSSDALLAEDSVISRIVSTLEPGKFSIFLPIPIHANPPALRSNFVAASQLVITVGAQRVHYAKASLLVEYRLICSKAHRVVVGQTFVETALPPALLNLLLFHWALSSTLLANKVNDPYSGCPYAANITGFVSANCMRMMQLLKNKWKSAVAEGLHWLNNLLRTVPGRSTENHAQMQAPCTGSSSWQAATLLSKQHLLEEQLTLRGKPAIHGICMLTYGELRPCPRTPFYRNTYRNQKGPCKGPYLPARAGRLCRYTATALANCRTEQLGLQNKAELKSKNTQSSGECGLRIWQFKLSKFRGSALVLRQDVLVVTASSVAGCCTVLGMLGNCKKKLQRLEFAIVVIQEDICLMDFTLLFLLVEALSDKNNLMTKFRFSSSEWFVKQITTIVLTPKKQHQFMSIKKLALCMAVKGKQQRQQQNTQS
ncbi:hypothetical protein Anapl_02028 [Anas platyrhynchos]|uniref:Uncharacterized protein n=1 Tax=Anas platyrhynchos TaxID=8839 RepID=R0KC66_ANAPL|nr:hypothetical protein Anapl_02028 [Anas platyrhynchos]